MVTIAVGPGTIKSAPGAPLHPIKAPTLPPAPEGDVKMMPPLPRHYGPWPPQPPRYTLNKTTPTVVETRGQVAASGSAIPLAYGLNKLGAMIGPVIEDGTDYVVGAYFCLGECQSIVNIKGDNKDLPDGSSWTGYLGTTSQTADPTLDSLITDYADGGLIAETPGGNIGICYAVVRYPKSAGFLELTAEIQTRKIEDPRENIVRWSEKYDETFWVKTNCSVLEQAAGTAANSFNASWEVTDDSVNNVHVIWQYLPNSAWSVGDKLYFGCYLKNNDLDTVTMLIYNSVDGSISGVDINLDLGTASAAIGGSVFSIKDCGDGWYWVVLEGTPSTQSVQTTVRIYLKITSSYIGTGQSFYMWGAQCAPNKNLFYSRSESSAVFQQTSTYSNNAGLVLANHWSDSISGRGRTVNTNSIIELAEYCDQQISDGEGGYVSRNAVNIAFTRQQLSDDISETLRFYANCYVDTTGEEVYFVPSAPVLAAVDSFNDTQIVIGSVEGEVIDTSNAPTAVRIWYTDTRDPTWPQIPVESRHPDVDLGTMPYRLSEIRAPGIQSPGQAKRQSVERLNAGTLEDTRLRCTIMDEALALTRGQVIEITTSIGITSKKYRLQEKVQETIGRFIVYLQEYQPNVYSDDVEIAPAIPDTVLADPLDPDTITGIATSEEIFTKSDGIVASRIRISWTASTYSYLDYYEARALVTGSVVWTGTTRNTEIPTSAVVQENVLHTCEVRAVSTFGAQGAWASDSITPLGNQLPPPDVTGFHAYEVAGQVYSYWDRAVDIGVVRYSIKWGQTTDTWGDLDEFDLVDTLRWTTQEIPPGTWRIFIKAYDMAGLYSTNATTVDVTVTTDARSYFVGDHNFRDNEGSWSLTNVFTFEHGDGRTCYFSYLSTDTLSGIFPNATSTYTDPWASYHGSVSATLTTTAKDYGASYQGTWRATCGAIEAKSGTISIELGLSTDDISYTWGAMTRNATARYAKIRVSTTTTNTMVLEDDVEVSIRLDVISHEERGIVTTGSGGKATVTLDNEYDALSAINLTCSKDNTGEANAQWDNVDIVSTPNTFDIYVHVNGTLTSGIDVGWQFFGIMAA